MKQALILLFLFTSTTLFAQSKKPKQATRTIMARAKSGSVVAAQVQPGAAIYKQYCLTCHQVNGSGVPGLNPPLRGTDWVNGDKTRLVNVLLNGLQNAEVDGEAYDNVMPAHDFLTDAQIADVLTYIRSNFTNKADAILVDEVTTQRAVKK